MSSVTRMYIAITSNCCVYKLPVVDWKHVFYRNTHINGWITVFDIVLC